MGKAATPTSYNTEVIVMGNCTIVVHRPELTAEMRAKRETELSRALNRYALHLAKQETEKEGVYH